MRILAVEDEADYREMLEEVMQGIGHTIVVAPNGAEALKILERETVDVIVADVAMPVMDGLEFHRQVRLKPEYANTPFVFLTGVSDISEVQAVCRRHNDLVLQKPFPVDALIRLFSGTLK